MKLEAIDLLQDVYYSKEYAGLYLTSGNELFEFDFQDGPNRFYNLSLKRPIDRIANKAVDEGYYDLETPYGYGGYYSTTADQEFLQKAFDAYQNRCKDENIIAEFVRFHPYNSFPLIAGEFLDFCAVDRQTVSIDLSIPKQARWSGYSSTTRNIIRRTTANLTFIQTEDIDSFMRMYKKTMDKNNAASFFYFSKDYYEKLLSQKNVKLFAVLNDNQVINMSFILFGKNLAHYHLSANDSGFSKLNGNYFLLDSVCDYSIQNHSGINHFHLGGGRSNLANDTLLAFKSKFSQCRNDFYICGKIYNKSVYQQYLEIFNTSRPEMSSIKYFLKYRLDSI